MIKLVDITRYFKMGDETIKAVDGVNFNINRGDLVAIIGPSGCGKSTLMHIIGLLDSPSGGELHIGDNIITNKSNINRLARLRSKTIGFVFQTFNLIPRISARANVELALVYGRQKDRGTKALKALQLVGLIGRERHKPNQLSGGERQRVAIARALANDPDIILADEPTGNLDSKSGKDIIKILIGLQKKGKTVIIVTHDAEIAKIASRIIKMKDGKII